MADAIRTVVTEKNKKKKIAKQARVLTYLEFCFCFFYILTRFQQLCASRPLKGPPHQSEKGAVTDGLGDPLPQTGLLPQSSALPLGSDLRPVQPFVETPVEVRIGQESDNGRSASQAQLQDLVVQTVAP